MINRLRIPKSEGEKEECLKAGDENEVYCRVLNFDQSGCIILLIHGWTHHKNVICHTIHFPTTRFPSGKEQHKRSRGRRSSRYIWCTNAPSRDHLRQMKRCTHQTRSLGCGYWSFRIRRRHGFRSSINSNRLLEALVRNEECLIRGFTKAGRRVQCQCEMHSERHFYYVKSR